MTAKQIYPGRVLEIGIGAASYHDELVCPSMLTDANTGLSPRVFNNGSVYIGTDLPGMIPAMRPFDVINIGHLKQRSWTERRLKLLQDHYRKTRNTEKILFLAADGTALPFSEGTFDEVYLGDVLGSELSSDIYSDILAESSRVLRTAGKLVVRETVTPTIADALSLPTKLAALGVNVTTQAERGTQEYAGYQGEYGTTIWEINRDTFEYGNPFIIIAEKT